MELQRVTPESVGIHSQAIQGMLDDWYRYGIEMHGFMLLRHGKVCAEGCWKPYQANTPHIMNSFSKSLTSTAIGFAVQEGILSINEKLVDIFPDKVPENPSENLKKVEIRHLLMMGCGHETEPSWRSTKGVDWIENFMNHPFVYEPGTHYLYNSTGTNLLCAILAKRTGMSLTEYLRPRLTEPLGMTDIYCKAMPDGTAMGAGGFFLTVEDMGRFIQFVANRGMWEGRQLLNAEWFDEATKKQIDNSYASPDPDWQAGYCYQYWRCAPEGVFRADGAFGQVGLVMSKQDAVLVFQSCSARFPQALAAVWDNVLADMTGDDPLPKDPEACQKLRERLAALELNPLFGARNTFTEAAVNGAVYTAAEATPAFTDLIGGMGKEAPKATSLQSLSLLADGDDVRLHCVQDDGEYDIAIDMTGHFSMTEIDGVPYGANGQWRTKNKLEVHFRNIRMAGGKRFIFEFLPDKLVVNADPTCPEASLLAEVSLPEMAFALKLDESGEKAKNYLEEILALKPWTI